MLIDRDIRSEKGHHSCWGSAPYFAWTSFHCIESGRHDTIDHHKTKMHILWGVGGVGVHHYFCNMHGDIHVVPIIHDGQHAETLMFGATLEEKSWSLTIYNKQTRIRTYKHIHAYTYICLWIYIYIYIFHIRILWTYMREKREQLGQSWQLAWQL